MTSRAHEKRMHNLHWRYLERPARLAREWWTRLLRRPVDNRPRIQREVDANRGRLVLFDFEVHRLLGWMVGEDDYWYVTIGPCGKIVRHSCVMGFVSLYGKISGFEYYYLTAVWNLNYPSYHDGLKMARECGFYIL